MDTLYLTRKVPQAGIPEKRGGVFFLRVKVRIVCRQCGESYILRGSKEQGIIQTGFKQCLCNSSTGFDIEERA
ncbi:hypothetical protein BK144_14540 [Paenibacillus sp. FSL R7-0273]|nr:hypothetical protein BK144_14540 [Paenibacillus sp. FSL R7-0273]